jgi:hypothetical protein
MLLQGAERQLWDASERALRHPEGKLVVVLHLSRLAAPRDYHVRVARVLLQETAQRHEGQVFTLANHDLVLLCTAPAGTAPDSKAPAAAGNAPRDRPAPHAPGALPGCLAQLFAVDLNADSALTSFWHLSEDTPKLHAYLEALAAQRSAPTATDGSHVEPVSLAALREIILHAPLAGLLVQQNGMSLDPDRSRPLVARLAPGFQAFTVALDRLSVDPLVAQAIGDPFLHRHFAQTLDSRLMQLLHQDLARHGRLLRAAAAQRFPVLLELDLRAIVSPEFAALSGLARAAGIHFWIAVSLLQAAAEPDLLDHAIALLKRAGWLLAINGIAPEALELVDPAVFRPDLVLLPWSPRLRQEYHGAPGRRIAANTIAPRVVLTGVDSDQALAWGQAHGVDLFAGPFLDQVQAATRMQACHSAAGCTWRQCLSRAAAAAPPGRSGCANPALLEAGPPVRRGFPK